MNAPQSTRLPRSPELMSRRDTALLVVDVQGKLVTLIPGHDRLIWNVRRLIDGAELLGLPIAATEQYPRGLGSTVPELAQRLGTIPDKSLFSCAECGDVFRDLEARGVFKVLVCGIEAHVCVQQTVFDLMAAGLRVYVAADAVGARHTIDYDMALRRMDSGGATITTTEAALFEWCETAATPEFKSISRLIQEAPPEA